MSAQRGAQRGRGGPGSGAGNSYSPRDFTNKSTEEITRELNEIMFNYNPKGTRREVRVNGQEFPPWVYNPDTVPDKTTVDFMFHPDVFKTKDCEKGSKCTLRACAFVHPGEKYVPRWRATGAMFDGQFVPPIPITYEWFRYLMLEFKIDGPCKETVPHDYGRCPLWHIDRKTGEPLDRRTPLRWVESREDWSPPVMGSQTAMSYHPLRYKCQPCNKIAAKQVCPRGRYCVHDHLNGDFRTIEKYLERLKRESLAEDLAKNPRPDSGPSLPVGMVVPQPAQKSPQRAQISMAAAIQKSAAAPEAAAAANPARENSQGPTSAQPSPVKIQPPDSQKPTMSSLIAQGQGAPKPTSAAPSQSTPAKIPTVPQPKPPAPVVPGVGGVAASKKPEKGTTVPAPKSSEISASRVAAGGGAGPSVPQPRPPQPLLPGTPLKTPPTPQDGKPTQAKQSGGVLPNKQQVSTPTATTTAKLQQPNVPRPEPPKPLSPPVAKSPAAATPKGSSIQPSPSGAPSEKATNQNAATGSARSTNKSAGTSTSTGQSPAVVSAEGKSPQKPPAAVSGGVQSNTTEISAAQPTPTAAPASKTASSGNGTAASGTESQPIARTPTQTGAALPAAGGFMGGATGISPAGLQPNAAPFSSVFSTPTTPFSSMMGNVGGVMPVTANSAPATPAISTTPTTSAAPPGFGYLPGEAGMIGNTLSGQQQQQASFPGGQLWGGQGGVPDMSRVGPGGDGGAQMYWQAVLQQQQVAQSLMLAQYLALQQQAVRNLQAAGLGGSMQMGAGGVQSDAAAGEQVAGVNGGTVGWQTMENQQIGGATPTPSPFPEAMGLYGGAFSPSVTPATLPPGLIGGVPYGGALGTRNLGFPMASPVPDMPNPQFQGVPSSNPATSATVNGPFGQYFAQGPPPPGFSLPSPNGLGAGFPGTPPVSGGVGGGSVGGASPARVVPGGISDGGEGGGETDLSVKEVRDWTKDDVHRWASNHSATQVRETADRLRSHDIDGELLRNLDDPGLKELGIVSFGQRKKLLTAVREEFGHDAAANVLPILDDSPSPHTNGMGFSFYST